MFNLTSRNTVNMCGYDTLARLCLPALKIRPNDETMQSWKVVFWTRGSRVAEFVFGLVLEVVRQVKPHIRR